MNQLFEIPLSKSDSLLKKFEEIHHYIYGNEGLSPQQTLEEFIKVLFIKVFDERQAQKQFHITAEEWNLLKNIKELNPFSERISLLFDEVKQTYTDIFDSNDRIKLSTSVLGFIINKLQNFSFADSSQDAKGLAFQKFISHQEKDGRGQFFTPEPIIDFCVEIISPQPHETIIDPTCGSGGFLISALKYLQKNNQDIDLQDIVSSKLFGLDINKSIARIAKMKLLLEANVKDNIVCTNSLEDLDMLKLLLSQKDGFDIILANPPFGTVGKITNNQTLSKFDLGYKWAEIDKKFYKTNHLSNGQTTEILFVERCLQLLKEGGRLAIVLPNGHFENPSLAYIRAYIREKAKILAIINLPQETFIPYGTGVKTSLLFLQKTSQSADKEYSIFFSKVKKLGYQGNKNGTPIYLKDAFGQIIKNEEGKAILDEDFSKVIADYQTFKTEGTINTENSFSIAYSELDNRFDYDFYSPENRKLLSKHQGNTVRLGDICDIVKMKSPKLKELNMNVEYIELSDVNTHSFEIINTTTHLVHELPSRASYELREGDIVTAIAGNSVGTKKHATAYITSEFEGCICTNGFRVLQNFRIDVHFLLYFFKTELFLRQMFMYRTGAAIPNVSFRPRPVKYSYLFA